MSRTEYIQLLLWKSPLSEASRTGAPVSKCKYDDERGTQGRREKGGTTCALHNTCYIKSFWSFINIVWVVVICQAISKTKQNKTKQNKTKQNKTKQNKTKQNKTKQNKTKQNKKWNRVEGKSEVKKRHTVASVERHQLLTNRTRRRSTVWRVVPTVLDQL